MNTNDIYEILILSLACWRISSLIVYEEGPGFIFTRIRHFVGVRFETEMYDDSGSSIKQLTLEEVIQETLDNNIQNYDKKTLNTFSILVNCVWCTSLWIALLIVITNNIFRNDLGFYNSIIISLTLSTLTIFIDKRIMLNEK